MREGKKGKGRKQDALRITASSRWFVGIFAESTGFYLRLQLHTNQNARKDAKILLNFNNYVTLLDDTIDQPRFKDDKSPLVARQILLGYPRDFFRYCALETSAINTLYTR